MNLPDNEEQKPEETVEEVVEGAVDQIVEEAKTEDRPERNYKAELDRKNREIERLRAEQEAQRSNTVQRRDANDISTWSDNELRVLLNSNDPNHLAYKAEADEILFVRRVERFREKERMQEKRVMTDLELKSKYPEALDTTSEFSAKMDEVMYQYDLQKSPAGRLAAARIVAAERQKGAATSQANERKTEHDRIARVKGQLVDGDRSKPPTNEATKTTQDLKEKALKGDHNALGEILKKQGISADTFFNR